MRGVPGRMEGIPMYMVRVPPYPSGHIYQVHLLPACQETSLPSMIPPYSQGEAGCLRLVITNNDRKGGRLSAPRYQHNHTREGDRLSAPRYLS